MNVSFDFDGTLHRHGRPLWPAIGLWRWHLQAGHRVVIVTTRTQAHEDADWWQVHEPDRVTIATFLSRYRLPVRRVLFTEHHPKANTLVRNGIELHYDDEPQEVALAQAAGVPSVLLNGVLLYV